MRILQIDKFLDSGLPAAGGAGTYIPLVTRLLQEAGHTVLRFGCDTGGDRRDMPRFIDYTDLPGWRAKLAGSARILHDFDAAAKLDAFLAGRAVDVAHVHRIYHHLTPAILPVLRRRGIAVVMSMRDYRLLCPSKMLLCRGRLCTRCFGHRYAQCVLQNCVGSRPAAAAAALETLFQRFFRRYIGNVDFFLCPSRFMAASLVRDGFPGNKVRVLANPIAPMDVSGPPEAGDGAVLYVGRLSEEKGPDLMLEVAAACPRRRVVLVGDGRMLPELQEQVRFRALKNVEFAGHVAHEDLGRCYGRADVVVLPSRALENSPHSMLEAMLAERCVVAADHPPIREWVRDGQTGRLFRPGSAIHLAAVVQEVLANAEARRTMAAAGWTLVRAMHSPGDVIGRLVRTYEQAVELRCASR